MAETRPKEPNGSIATAEIRENFHDMSERLAYSLHFHSISHYLSADRYEIRDRWLTYLAIFTSTVCMINAGFIINDYMKSVQTYSMIFALLSTVCSVLLSSIMMLNSSEQSPRNKKTQHSRAGSKLKELEQKVDVWGRTSAMDPSQSTESLRKEYNMFLSEMTTLKEDHVKSEDWTFPTVHKQLGKKWKAVKEKDDAKKRE